MKLFDGRRKHRDESLAGFAGTTIDITAPGSINIFTGHISEGRIVGIRPERDGLHSRVELEIDGRNYIFTSVNANVAGLSPGDKVKFANKDGVLTRVQFLAD